MALPHASLSAQAWLSTRPPASLLVFGPPTVDVRPSGEGRGLGLFASRSVPKHHCVLSDPALVLMSPTDDLPELYAQFLGLSQDDQARYLALGSADNPDRDALLASKLRDRDLYKKHGEAGVQQMVRVAGIMQTNAFSVDLHDGLGPRHRALFPRLARTNHSCMPNAHVCYYPPSSTSEGTSSKGRMVVHTLRPLEPGEEVLISYFDILLPRTDRRARTKKWGFECRCRVCTEDEEGDGVSLEDQKRYLREWLALQARAADRESLTTAIDIGTTLLQNAEVNPSLSPAFPNMFDGLAILRAKRILTVGETEEGRVAMLLALERAAVWEANLTGPESQSTRKRVEKVREFAAGRDRTVKIWVERNAEGSNELQFSGGKKTQM